MQPHIAIINTTFSIDDVTATIKLMELFHYWIEQLDTKGAVTSGFDIAGAPDHFYVVMEELRNKVNLSSYRLKKELQSFTVNVAHRLLVCRSNVSDIDLFSDILQVLAIVNNFAKWELIYVTANDQEFKGLDSGIIFTDGYIIDQATITELYQTNKDISSQDDRQLIEVDWSEDTGEDDY